MGFHETARCGRKTYIFTLRWDWYLVFVVAGQLSPKARLLTFVMIGCIIQLDKLEFDGRCPLTMRHGL